MRRSRIVIVAIALAVIGAVLPIAGMLYVSWRFAVRAEENRLTLFANRAITRANISLTEARDVLHAMSGSGLPPCAPEHIARMRTLALDALSVGEIGYFENHILKCTSWGMTEERIPQLPGDYKTADGIDVTVRMHPLISGGKPMMALQYQDYNVLVDPLRFVDVIVDPGIHLAIANEQGTEIAELNAPDPKLVRSIVADPHKGIDDSNLFAVARAAGWIAVATENRGEILNKLRREQLTLVPIGAFIATFIVGIVVWFSRKRLSPLGELTLAVQNREFVVDYQPIVELKTGRCVGAEALARWRRPDGSLVRPDLFIPLAEDSGLILPITDQVIDTVMGDLGALLAADRSLHVSFNICADDLRTGRILPVVEKALKGTGILTSQVWLEITERSFLEIDAARSTIVAARKCGHAVVIDDFGTGYSSLQYLEGLPLDALKIDKSFVETIGRSTATSSVTSHIIDMAKALNLFVVAEGIETREQLDYLRARAVEFGQGWLFGRAMAADQLIASHIGRRQAAP